MKKIISAVASIAIVGAVMMMFVPMPNAAASAQAPLYQFSCKAVSADAIGWGNAPTVQVACNRALYECARLTNSYNTCYATEWWRNW